MFGIKTEKGDQILFGPALKSFVGDIGHKKTYWGAVVHTNLMIGRITPFLSYEMMWGKYYIFGAEADKTVGIRSGRQGKGVVGVGYAINNDVSVFAGAAAQDYDPEKYFKSQRTPYKSGSIVLKVSANVAEIF